MNIIHSQISPLSAELQQNKSHFQEEIRPLHQRLPQVKKGGGKRAVTLHRQHNKLFAHERIDLLVDPGVSFLELSPLVAFDMYDNDATATSIRGSHSNEVMIVANNAKTPVELHVSPLDQASEHYQAKVGDNIFELSARLFVASVRTGGDMLLPYNNNGKEYRHSEYGHRRRVTPCLSDNLQASTASEIIQILVQPGNTVDAETPLLILEAMKMQHQIATPEDSVVHQILCAEGNQVTAGAEFLILRDATADATNPASSSFN